MKSPLVPEYAMLNVQKFLDGVGSGLARVRFTAEGSPWTAAAWIEHNAARFRIRPEWLLDLLQKEQRLVLESRTLLPNFSVQAAPPPPPDYKTPSPDVPATRYVRTHGGWFRVYGVWRMIAATGAGIPDPGAEPPWDVGEYLGFASQVYQAGRLTARYIDSYNRAVMFQDADGRMVTLYPTAEEISKAKAEGRAPLGEKVLAKDVVTFARLQWTPSLEAAALMADVHSSLARRSAEFGA